MHENEGIRVRAMPKCPLCGRSGFPLHSGLRDRFWAAPGVWSFRRCESCGHVWLDPFPLPDEIGKVYGSYYTHGQGEPNPFDGESLWARCRRGVVASFGYPRLARDERDQFLGALARLVPPIREECDQFVRSLRGPPGGLLLDAGCGDGFYLSVMRGLGWDVRGLEPDSRAAAVARGRGIDVAETTLEEAFWLPNDAFDVITMGHVIEHVLDPVRTLKAARRLLKPRGRVLILTPNIESWGHALFGSSWFHLDPPRHCHLFNVRNLIACAERAGLSVVRWKTSGGGHLVYDGSRSIRRWGRFHLGDPSIRATNRDRLFRLAEQAILTVRPERGEEIVLTCMKDPTREEFRTGRTVPMPGRTR